MAKNQASSASTGLIPGRKWVFIRRTIQSIFLVSIIFGPFLSGWQRIDHSNLSAWDSRAWDLPAPVAGVLDERSAPTVRKVNRIIGGGSASSWFDIAAVDPVVGSVAILSGSMSVKIMIAWLIPILLAAIGGRFFCGWMCPFGTIARFGRRVTEWMPGWFPRYRVPKRRPIRWIILVATLLCGGLASWSFLYVTLPHLIMQQASYTVWLLGGVGSAMGMLIGLMLAGFVFGPTTYCATLCPTGASLALAARIRRFGIWIHDKPNCGRHCDLCTKACWLSLDPASGEPGPDCDGCTRCFAVCPKTNLRVGRLAVRKTIAMMFVVLFLGRIHLHAQDQTPFHKPLLLGETQFMIPNGQVHLGVWDYYHVKMGADAQQQIGMVEVSVSIMRGARPAPDALGRSELREVYRGPIKVGLYPDGAKPYAYELQQPNAPRSVGNRTIFRTRVDVPLTYGDRIVIHPVQGWFDEPIEWILPYATHEGQFTTLTTYTLIGFLVASGLFSFALVVR